MPAPKGNKFYLKRKAESCGRPSITDEKIRTAVVDTCWETLYEILNNPETDAKTKIMIALKICPKSMPTVIETDNTGLIDEIYRSLVLEQ